MDFKINLFPIRYFNFVALKIIAGSDLAVSLMRNRLIVKNYNYLDYFSIRDVISEWIEDNTTGAYYMSEPGQNKDPIIVAFELNEDLVLFKLHFEGYID